MDNYIEKIKNKNIHIVGAFGAEGSAVLEFLAKSSARNITAHDFSADRDDLWQNFSKTHIWIKKKIERLVEFENILKMPARLNFKSKYLEGIMEADIIFAPSSWRLYKPNFLALQNAQDKGIEFSSLTKLYFQLAKGKIISVTGTKGKGTTSRLIYEILLKINGERNVYLAGNDRRAGQELEKISKMGENDILVLETSNRQLMADTGRSPDIGVITNISPDHIDEHGSFENYIETKKSLFNYSGKTDIAVLNYDNEITRKIGEELSVRGVDAYFFSRKGEMKKGIYLEKDKIYASIKRKEYICDIRDIKLIGQHNIENILAASLAARLAGASPEKIQEAIRNFHGLPHRIEFIGEYEGIHPVKSRGAGISQNAKLFNGVRFYDDSASTNPDSTIAAIEALKNTKHQTPNIKLILVAGGDDKGMDYTGLANEITGNVDMLLILPGSGSEKIIKGITNQELGIKNEIQSAGGRTKENSLIIKECNDFSVAIEIIKKQIKTGDIVLISPACAHFQARYIDVLEKPLRNLIVEKFR